MARVKNKESVILQSAMKVFSEKGFSKTSMQDIAEEAGIGKGTIYEYFKSKDEVFTAGYSREVELFLEVTDRVAAKELAFQDKFEELLLTIQEAAEKKSRKMKLLVHDSRGDLKNESREILDQMHANLRKRNACVFEKVLRQGIDEQVVTDHNVEFTAKVLIDFIFVFFMMNQNISDAEDDKKKTRLQLVELMMKGIAKREGASDDEKC